MIGQTISHYKILEKLGEGGMGIVYRAQDLKLNRVVALKFLPHRISTNETEKARFLQEAQAAAVLNHPNICTIHAIEEYDGEMFIVMECVDGVTLRQKEQAGGIKYDVAIQYAVQIGDALQEAHSKGIVHRDVKAENVMVNSKNQIKVMDFGLAKLKGSLKLTKTSSTVGTLAYMAPEQIQGGEVDARSDIFSFGVLLFEMLTGHLPFRGEHDAAMMYSIVNEQPEPIEKYLPEASSESLHIFNRALEKDPEERYQTVHDMVIDLRRLKKETSRVSRELAVSSGTQSSASHDAKPMSRKPAWLGIGAVVVLAVAALVFFWPRSTGELNPDSDRKKTEFDLPLTAIGYAGLTADGKFLAFPAADANGKWDIYSMHASSKEPKRITFDSTDLTFGYTVGAVISPDSRLIAYARRNKSVGYMEGCIVPLLGGRPKVIGRMNGFRWRPDGQRLGYIHVVGDKLEFWTISSDGSDKRLVFTDTLGGRYSFAWSPDGQSIAWLHTFDGIYQEIMIRTLATGRERQLTFGKKNIDEIWWATNDQILFSSNIAGTANIWTVPSTGGKPVQITTGEGPDLGITMSADCKKLVYTRMRSVGYLWRALTDGSEAKQLTREIRRNTSPSFSPDRKQIVFASIPDEISVNSAIYIADREGQDRRELVPATARNSFPIWSPDGRWIAYSSRLSTRSIDTAIIYLIDPAGTEKRQLLVNGVPRSWRDPNTFVFRRGMQYWEANIQTGEQKPVYKDSTFAVSVMGKRYLCYRDQRAATDALWITPSQYAPDLIGTKSTLLARSDELGTFNTMTARESSVLLYDDRGAVQRVIFPTGIRERIHGTFPGLRKDSYINESYDGKEIVYVQDRLDSKLVMIENLFK
jgi:serine/threonine protein kinase/Tol biopolymer transport system component